MKIIYVGPYTGEEEIVKELLPSEDVVFVKDIDSAKAEDLASAEVLAVFVDTPVTLEVIEKMPMLKHIAARSTGYDHINLKSAKDKDIVVSHVPHYGAETVAEYAFALMFAISRNVYRSYVDIQDKTNVPSLEPYEGFTLSGKTLGVVGTGTIGKHAAVIGKGLGMRVLAYDVSTDEDWAARHDVVYMPLDELLSESDIVTLHVPALPATEHMIDEEELKLMKKSAYLINTARGSIINTAALVAAVRDGVIAGAALDVLEGEPELHDELELLGNNDIAPDTWHLLAANHALIDLPNVIVTPHIAFNTREAKREITETTLENINNWAEGGSFYHVS